jgi:hypothetical protein
MQACILEVFSVDASVAVWRSFCSATHPPLNRAACEAAPATAADPDDELLHDFAHLHCLAAAQSPLLHDGQEGE